MNRRFRNRSTAVDGYLRYLKPGALAQLRDSKINAKSHHRSSKSQIYILQSILSSSPVSVSSSGSPNSTDDAGAIAVVDVESPCFTVRFYGPSCPQRKKLMAARSMFCSEPATDGTGPVTDGFSNEFLAAH
ncbi:hypothetical protein QVD17_05712 [Tagetes erecta]|uniref:Uncharacterized protein n=1 Tax=Tagetes erecta TaxID=13708 RepID=A0AAD8LEV3_TARER|nr:hypothetical protein QVD17_05712 [Tagetes erecta]